MGLLKSTLTGLLPILYVSSPLPFWLLLEAVSQEIICIQILGSGPASSRSRSVTLTDSSGDENGIHTCRQLRIPRKPHCVSTRIICSLLSENSKKRGSGPWGKESLQLGLCVAKINNLVNFLVIYIICVVEDERRQITVHPTNERRCTEFST